MTQKVRTKHVLIGLELMTNVETKQQTRWIHFPFREVKTGEKCLQNGWSKKRAMNKTQAA